MSRSSSSRSGLSLLELLVSLALLALIGAGLAGAFGLGNQMWTRTAALGQQKQEIALRFKLRHYMSQILPPTRLTPFERPFSGGRDGLTFITLAETPFASAAAAMRMALLSEGTTLTMTTELLDDDGEPLESWTDVLATGANEITFDYWGTNEGVEGWLPEWTSDVTLPRLIRVRIDDGSVPPWPGFIVRPLLQ